MARHRVMLIFGTRPEIIKLGPVYRALRARCEFEVETVWTGQHVELADGLLELFGIEISHKIDHVMALPGLAEKTGEMVRSIDRILRQGRFNSVVVQGDTVSAMAGAIAGFLNSRDVAHVEAGLRTHDLYSPWPEEFARRVISVAATLHFAPTQIARRNLLGEGIGPERILVTGNTVTDALRFTRGRLAEGYEPHSREIADLPADRKLILVTGHRRENFGEPLRRILSALRTLAADGDKLLLFPVHLNPEVRREVAAQLRGHDSIRLVEPLRYLDFVHLLGRAWTVVTDSGGIQEEAPSFQIPIVITRETTERPEVVEAGFGHLVGSDPDAIVASVRRLTAGSQPTRVKGVSPFGDGFAAERIVSALLSPQQPGASVQIGTGHSEPADSAPTPTAAL